METICSSSSRIFCNSGFPPVRAVGCYPLPLSCCRSLSWGLGLKKLNCGRRLRLRNSSAVSSLRQASKNSRISCGIIREVNESEFSDVVLKSERPVLVEFLATWCGPCRLIGPAMESVAQEYADKLVVIKIDHDSNPSLIEEYKVYGLPTLILFKNGQEVADSRREGAMTKVKLKEYLDALLEAVSVA